jgi:quercetin dioxygenase-like cupin family protein
MTEAPPFDVRQAGQVHQPGEPVVEGGRWKPRTYSQLPLHVNQGLELVLICSGQATWLVDGVPHGVRAGDLFFTLPWQVHGSAEPVDPAISLDWLVLPLTGQEPTTARAFHGTAASRRDQAPGYWGGCSGEATIACDRRRR